MDTVSKSRQKRVSRRTKLLWLWLRLRAMTPIEILARTRNTMRKMYWRTRDEWRVPQPRISMRDPWTRPEINTLPDQEVALLLNEADSCLQGRYHLLNISSEQAQPDWHLDPETGIRAPRSFALDIDYRNYQIAGNVKNIWEINRHRHLTVLATAFALTRDERYALEVERQLRSWIDANPLLKGVNWHSALELGIRLIAWVWVERLLRGCPPHERLFGADGILWPAIYHHQWLITQLMSVGSSANNHLVGELAGLFIASTTWPYFVESAAWRRLSQAGLEREIGNQTFKSGLNCEQAFSYHLFSLELFLLAAIEGDRAQTPFTREYKTTVQQMLEVIPELLDIGGNLPAYGDEDGGTALQLESSESAPLDWLFRLGRTFVEACVPLPARDSGRLAATLISPTGQGAACDYLRPQGSRGFEDAGLYVLTANRGKPSEIFCLADAGDLGFLSIAAHGHADALSFTLSVGGQMVIIDPGTYSYFSDAHWRTYFRSTRAHNTITIDGADQSEPGGAFLWIKKAHCRVLQWSPLPNGAELIAEHDGYTRLPEAVVHRRRIAVSAGQMEIVDDLSGEGDHELEWRLHFAPECSARLQNDGCHVQWNGGEATIELSPLLQWRLESGTQNAGWTSPAYNRKIPTTTLIGHIAGPIPPTLAHIIRLGSAEES